MSVLTDLKGLGVTDLRCIFGAVPAHQGVAMAISLVNHPNDEARISLELGLPIWLLPGIAVAFLLALTVMGSRTVKAGWTGNLIAYLMASLLTTVIVFLDPGPLF